MSLNPLDHPIVLMDAGMLTDVSGWTQHLPFAFLLADLLRPRTFVELGAHKGDSYCAFCQAFKRLQTNTRCTAVDTWTGDAHSGQYGPDVLRALRAHHDPLYASFSTLLQSTFDDAAPQFEDASIDLLHIDGLHTYDAVRHDFETWRPKLSERAVVLFHDTAERDRDFGVWRLWEELAMQFPNLHLPHGHGLGVLAVGADIPPAARPLFHATPVERDALIAFLAALGLKQDLRRALSVLMSSLFQEQQAINQWKGMVGAPVDPPSRDPGHAINSPYIFAKRFLADVRAVAQDDLRLRQTLQARR